MIAPVSDVSTHPLVSGQSERIGEGDSIDERIASSDYSRSGWCPGSDVPAMKFNLGKLEAGTHQLTIDVPDAQRYTDAAMNFWNVAAYLTWQRPEEL